MHAEKAVRFRTVYGYAAVACAALAVWGAASPTPMPGVVRALAQTGRDSQLPLERFAIEAARASASSLQPKRQAQHQLPGQPFQPAAQTSRPARWNQPNGVDADNGDTETDRSVDTPGTPPRKSAAPGYYRKIKNWKNWT